MSRSTLSAALGLLLCLLLGVALLQGCGTHRAGDQSSGASPRAHASTAAPLTEPGCYRRAGARRIVVGTGPLRLVGEVIGHSDRVVITSNQSNQDLCAWVPFARRLAARGVEVVLYDYTTDYLDSLQRMLTRVHRRAGTVALLGGSVGAMASLVAGARHPDEVDAVVSLSGEDAFSGIVVADAVRHLRAPAMFVAARHDPLLVADAARRYQRIAPSKHKHLLLVGGSRHGTALLAAPRVARAVADFLVRRTR
ncbi:MAG: alpha/beta hydrolase [Marmoricola sp.]